MSGANTLLFAHSTTPSPPSAPVASGENALLNTSSTAHASPSAAAPVVNASLPSHNTKTEPEGGKEEVEEKEKKEKEEKKEKLKASLPMLSLFAEVREGSEEEAHSALKIMFGRLGNLRQRRCRALRDREVLPASLAQMHRQLHLLWGVVLGEEAEPSAAAEEEAAQPQTVLGEEPTTQPGLISEELKAVYVALFRASDESFARSEWEEFVHDLTGLTATVKELEVEVAGLKGDAERLQQALGEAERMLKYTSEQQGLRRQGTAADVQRPPVPPLLTMVDKKELEWLHKLGGGSYGKVSLVRHERKTYAFKETCMRDGDEEVRDVIDRIGLGLSVNLGLSASAS